MTSPPSAAAGSTVDIVGVVHVFRVSGTDVAALRGADLHVDAGEHVALLGPSGSGKSTLLSIVAGLRRPSAGSVLIDGIDIARASERRLYDYRAKTVGLMLQGAASNLLPYTTPAENVYFATGAVGRDNPVLRAAGLSDETRPVSRLDRVSQQATALAVAMAGRPRLLLVDEPTSQLDDLARDQLLDAMAEVTRSTGTTLLMVTHDEEVASRLERSVRMRSGRVGSEGERDEQYAVVGADGSVQLPEELLESWPAGSRVEITAVSPTRIHLDLVADREAD